MAKSRLFNKKMMPRLEMLRVNNKTQTPITLSPLNNQMITKKMRVRLKFQASKKKRPRLKSVKTTTLHLISLIKMKKIHCLGRINMPLRRQITSTWKISRLTVNHIRMPMMSGRKGQQKSMRSRFRLTERIRHKLKQIREMHLLIGGVNKQSARQVIILNKSKK